MRSFHGLTGWLARENLSKAAAGGLRKADRRGTGASQGPAGPSRAVGRTAQGMVPHLRPETSASNVPKLSLQLHHFASRCHKTEEQKLEVKNTHLLLRRKS